MSVLIVGSTALDSIETPKAENPRLLGGSASHAAVAASYFSPVNLVGVVGADFPRRYIQLYRRHGIDLAGLQILPGKTFHWSGEYEANMNNRRTLLTELGVFEHFTPTLPSAMDLWLNVALPDLLRLIKRLDAFVLNDSEAHQLTQEENMLAALRKIHRMGPKYVVIKQGSHGSVLSGPRGLFLCPAYPLRAVVDPTGAGDSFAGAMMGYLAAAKGPVEQHIRRATIYGTAVASFCCEGFGLKCTSQLTRPRIEMRVRELEKLTRF